MTLPRRQELTDVQWDRLDPLLPPHRARTGRPAHDHRTTAPPHHRTIVKGMLGVLRSGAPWRDLPARSSPWQTVYARVRRWQQAGVWAGVLTARPTQAAADGTLDLTLPLIDGTQAPIAAPTSKRRAPNKRATDPVRHQPRRVGQHASPDHLIT